VLLSRIIPAPDEARMQIKILPAQEGAINQWLSETRAQVSLVLQLPPTKQTGVDNDVPRVMLFFD
jgi:hypothetical protein